MLLEQLINQPLSVRCGQNFNIFPRYGQKEWETIDPQLKNSFIACADRILEQEIPALPATLYIDFQRTGNRSRFETRNQQRMDSVYVLALAECMDGKGKYTDKLVDYIWAICEQTSWVVPAHNNHENRTGSPYALPNLPAGITVDLMSGMMGATLSCVYYIVREALDRVSPIVSRRIKAEVRARVIDPVMQTDDFGWMGLSGRGRINNWNPWIISNVLTCALFLLDDAEYVKSVLLKSLRVLDQFIGIYHADGGCDEGPGYWNAAGGALFDALDLMFWATDGAIDVYEEPLILNIGDYIRKVHLNGKCFANFGDNGYELSFGSSNIYRMAEATKNEPLRQFALYMITNTRKDWFSSKGIAPWKGFSTQFSIRILYDIFHYSFFLGKDVTYTYDRDCWMPDIQVMVAHEREDGGGLVLTAKGAHNDESHNHNDVGQFMVYYDGKPVLIDMGVGAYTKKTFSPQRYEIFTMQSGYHNLPTVNGVMQKDGREYAARVLGYNCNGTDTSLLVSLKDAYPQEAKIGSWERNFVLDRMKSCATVTDTFSFADSPSEACWNLITCCKPELGDGSIRIADCKVVYNGCPVTVSVEEIAFDEDLRKKWGGSLYRIILCMTEKRREGSFTVKISPEK